MGEKADEQQQHVQSCFSFFSASWPLTRSPSNSLEIKIDDDVVEVLAAVEALQILGGDGDPTFQRRRGKLD